MAGVWPSGGLQEERRVSDEAAAAGWEQVLPSWPLPNGRRVVPWEWELGQPGGASLWLQLQIVGKCVCLSLDVSQPLTGMLPISGHWITVVLCWRLGRCCTCSLFLPSAVIWTRPCGFLSLLNCIPSPATLWLSTSRISTPPPGFLPHSDLSPWHLEHSLEIRSSQEVVWKTYLPS